MTRHAQEFECSNFEMTANTAQFERKYEDSLRLSMRLLNAEKARVQCIERLFLEFENSDLRSQLNQTRDELLDTAETEHNIRVYLHSACTEVDRLQASSHATHDFHGEMVTLRAAAAENDKLLAEKTRLSDHLSSLQSGFDQLKAQTSSVETILSEKQDLQRQLSTLGGQLEKERRTCEHIRGTQSHQAETISNLNARLQEANRELSEEVEARKRLEDSMQRQTAEGQPSAVSTKFEPSKQEPAARKEQFQIAQSQPQPHGDNITADQHIGCSPPTAGRVHNDLAIATPGAMGVHNGVQRSAALPGDKSAFSITPFLSRANAARDSPSWSEEESDELHLVNEVESPPPKRRIFNETRNFDGTLESKLASATAIPGSRSKRNTGSRKSEYHSVAADLSSGKGSNRFEDDRQGQGLTLQGHQSSRMSAPRAKKRTGPEPDSNLVGGEMEMDVASDVKKPGRKVALGARHGFNQPDISGGNRLARFPRSRAFGGFADFSPLKRNKR